MIDPVRDPKKEKPTPPWLLIPVGMLLIVFGGITACVMFAIAGIIDGLTEAFRTLLLTLSLLIRFPAAAIAQSRNR
jgi:hypothetical protein